MRTTFIPPMSCAHSQRMSFNLPAHFPNLGERKSPFPSTHILKPVMILYNRNNASEAVVSAPTQKIAVTAGCSVSTTLNDSMSTAGCAW